MAPVSATLNAQQFADRFPNADKDWADINEQIDASDDDASREYTVDPAILGVGARPSRVDGETL
ncbi:hypothetical protein GCM10025867_46870 (plasmid) [Frondihabitans sucicola]|uniref:Uncharacterized protein n=1 Tax=Frondihabitans sucicola TaxID=1268041 RepID=A0ABM8GVF3_9MICO|nr:hypothetical protein [Frondihabitans sucicola]BDZ52446.1 hypothetical protein GCM10025867_46870 [Frondihabitans sucicola]